MTEPSDEMLELFDRAFAHVPLSLYDEHLKPAQRALSDLLARLREVDADRAAILDSGLTVSAGQPCGCCGKRFGR